MGRSCGAVSAGGRGPGLRGAGGALRDVPLPQLDAGRHQGQRHDDGEKDERAVLEAPAAHGFGPLQDLLRAPTITEIMVVTSDQIFVERDGIIERSGRRFHSEKVT